MVRNNGTIARAASVLGTIADNAATTSRPVERNGTAIAAFAGSISPGQNAAPVRRISLSNARNAFGSGDQLTEPGHQFRADE